MFAARYPGQDWRKFTIAAFLRFVELAPQVGAYVSGNWTKEADDNKQMEDLERRLDAEEEVLTMADV